MAGAGTSMLGSLVVFAVILSLQEIYRGKLASSELFTILGGFTSSLLFLFSLTFIGNFQESSGIKSGWGAVELLLGNAYSDWGHISDAIAVYDQLITAHPEDFRGYLAKGIILRENGSRGDAERMFIQARFFAPDKAKALVDRYSKL